MAALFHFYQQSVKMDHIINEDIEMKPKTGRKFLHAASHYLDAIGWKVKTHHVSGYASGSFALTIGYSSICIHTLDYYEVERPDLLYVQKLNKILNAIQSFRQVMGTREISSHCEWLNSERSGATGCIAFYNDTVSENKMVFFEISSCTNTIRLSIFDFKAYEFNRLDRLLVRIHDELVRHRSAMQERIDYIDSTRKL